MSFISVVIPLYNKEKDVEATLKSVFAQTFQDYEVIVVNDGSTDNSLSIVEKFMDPRLKIFSIPNGGVSVARNYGVENGLSEYIAFLDADDYWYPNHLQNLYDLIKKFPCGKWYATAYEIKHNKWLTLPMNVPPMKYGNDWMGEIQNFFKNSTRDCMAWTSAVCMRKDFFCELGGFNINLQVDQDIDLWVRAALQSNLYFLGKVSATYNLCGDNHISDGNILRRNIMDFDFYECKYPLNQELKVYLDLNRYSVAIKYKIHKEERRYREYLLRIASASIGLRKSLLLRLPRIILLLLLSTKVKLESLGIRIRTS